MKKSFKIICLILCVILILGMVMTAVDYCRLRYGAFEEPIFCTWDYVADGSSVRLYRGLFHKIEIRGNFMPLDEFPGVTEYTFYIFGIKVHHGIRD